MSKLGDALKASNKQAAIDKINTISDGDWKKESDAAVKELGGKQTSTTSKSSSSSSSSSGVANITSIFDVKQSFSYDNNEVTSPFDLASKVAGNGLNVIKDLKLAAKEVLDQLTLENNVRTAVNEKIGEIKKTKAIVFKIIDEDTDDEHIDDTDTIYDNKFVKNIDLKKFNIPKPILKWVGGKTVIQNILPKY